MRISMGNTTIKGLVISTAYISISKLAFGFCAGRTSETFGSGYILVSISRSKLTNNSIIVPNCIVCGNGPCPMARLRSCIFNNSRIGSISVPAAMAGVKHKIFYGVPCLGAVRVPSNMHRVNSFYFDGYAKLIRTLVPSNIMGVNVGLFRNYSGVTGIILPGGLRAVRGQVFGSYEGLGDIALPTGLGSVPSRYFCGYMSLATISVPSSLVSVK